MKKYLFSLILSCIIGYTLPVWADELSKIVYVPISNENKIVYRTVNIAVGEVLVIEFPDGIKLSGIPVVGDNALLRVEVEKQPLRMRVWALLFPGRTERDMSGISSNIQFSLNSGHSFIFRITVTDSNRAANRIVISYPEWDKETKRLKQRTEQYRAELDKRYKKRLTELSDEISKKSAELLAKSFSEFFQCNTYRVRSEEKLVFFSSDRMCKIGVNGFIIINFLIKNRARKQFLTDTITVYALRGTSRVEIDSPVLFLQKYSMLFDEVVSGAVAFRIEEEGYAKRYELVLKESAGQQRKLTITVSF